MTRYIVSFDRIGRNHFPPDLITGDLDSSGDLEDAILSHSRPFHASSGREVSFDGDERGGKGVILCGWNNGGNFTYAPTNAEVSQ